MDSSSDVPTESSLPADEENPVQKWIFDNWSLEHWHEKRKGIVSETLSWVEVDTRLNDNLQMGLRVFKDKKLVLTIQTDRDLWGTWIWFGISGKGTTIAQEDGTMSFMEAFLAGLNYLKQITDIGTLKPVPIPALEPEGPDLGAHI